MLLGYATTEEKILYATSSWPHGLVVKDDGRRYRPLDLPHSHYVDVAWCSDGGVYSMHVSSMLEKHLLSWIVGMKGIGGDGEEGGMSTVHVDTEKNQPVRMGVYGC